MYLEVKYSWLWWWLIVDCSLFISFLQNSNTGFLSLFEGLLEDIFRISSLVSRVSSHLENGDYLTEVEDKVELSDARDELLNRVSSVITQVSLHKHLL